MSSKFDEAIEALQQELANLSQRMTEIKKAINQLYIIKREAPPYSDLDDRQVNGMISIAPDTFFGKPLATAVKEFLRLKGRAATAQEIFEALKKGGYEWGQWKEELRLKNLAISLSKNRNDFVLIPIENGNAYGLWEFYPEKERQKKEKIKQQVEEPIQKDEEISEDKEQEKEEKNNLKIDEEENENKENLNKLF